MPKSVEIGGFNFKEKFPWGQVMDILVTAWKDNNGSQRKLAAELGVAATVVCDWAKGRRPMPPWYAVAYLLRETQMELVVGPQGVTIRPVTRKKADFDWIVDLPEDFV
jgi:hypothetical protein